MTASKEALERAENQLLLALPFVTHALHAISRVLSEGCVKSELDGAWMDLRHAANRIETISKEWPATSPSLIERGGTTR